MEKIGGSPAVDQFPVFVETVCAGKCELNLLVVVALKRLHDLGIRANRILTEGCSKLAHHSLNVFQVAKHRVWVFVRNRGNRQLLGVS